MARIRGYIAASLDGFIADEEGGVGWLDAFNEGESGYAGFIAEIGTVVMGRRTFEQIQGFGIGWPYAGISGIVLSSRELDLPEGVSRWTGGVDALIAHLRHAEGGDVWVVGGSQLQDAFIERGGLDRLEVFVAPVLLGTGTRLFNGVTGPRPITASNVRRWECGLAHLDYEFG